MGQIPRDDWKPGNARDADRNLAYSLADAPLSAKERVEIYRLLDSPAVHDSFTDAQRAEERETVMGARVGFIEASSRAGVTRFWCKGRGCSAVPAETAGIWFSSANANGYDWCWMPGARFLVRNSSSHGFRDVATSWHMSAYETLFNVYRWNGTKYVHADCYSVNRDRDNPDKPPMIAGCRHEGT